MFYSRILPPEHLKPFIKGFHFADLPLDGPQTVPSPPTGYPLFGRVVRGMGKMFVNGRPHPIPPLPMNHISGPLFRTTADVCWNGHITHALIELSATGLYELLGIAGADVVNKTLPLALFAPDLDNKMEQTLGSARTAQHYFDFFLGEVEARIPDRREVPDYISQTIASLEDSFGLASLEQLVCIAPVGVRTFTTSFQKIVGLPPKYFARVLQFNHVAELVLSGDTDSLAQLAVEAGYYDQAHLTKVFNEFVLASPGKFLHGDYQKVASFVRLIDESGTTIQ